MLTQDEYVKFLTEAYDSVRSGKTTWAELANTLSTYFGYPISGNALRKRAHNYVNYGRVTNIEAPTSNEAKTNGSSEKVMTESFKRDFVTNVITAKKIVSLTDEEKNDPIKMMSALGYNPDEWEFRELDFSTWEQNSKKDGKSDLYAVKFKIGPRKGLIKEDILDGIREVLRTEPKSLYPKVVVRGIGARSNNLLMEIPPIELHIGKLAHHEETGDDYCLEIARNAFYEIIRAVLEKQQFECCANCLLVIGSDFFNSESDCCTTGKTPQQNDTRYKKLFSAGLQMYTDAINSLKPYFDHMDVILCAGNHARAMEFFLYEALKGIFNTDEKVAFSEDTKDTQAYVFGKCGLFFNHGDANLQRTQRSIPAEFPTIWGETKYRELHMGHLHKEVVVDDEGGMITRRIGSPCGTDAWHYTERYVGATKQHQIFIWDKEDGLQDIYYIHTHLHE